MKNILIYLVIGAVVGIGVWFVRSGGELPMMARPEVTPFADEVIILDAPMPNSTISSPQSVSGQARGWWFFEADFPVEVKDAGGTTIGTGIATAQSPWMTNNFVPFIATVTFPSQPSGSTGTLILHRDNPSGEPANDDSRSIPIYF